MSSPVRGPRRSAARKLALTPLLLTLTCAGVPALAGTAQAKTITAKKSDSSGTGKKIR